MMLFFIIPPSALLIDRIHLHTKHVIEMQLAEKKDFNDRLVYYSTFPIREQIRGGIRNYNLEPLYIIAIMDFSMDSSRTTDSVINSFCIRNDNDNGRILTDNVHFVTVELPKFHKGVGELESMADRMIWLLRNMGSLKSVPEKFSGKGFDKLFDISNFTAMTYEEQMDYLCKFHAELDRRSELETAIEKGLAQGLEKGLAQGLEKGLAKGLAEGKEQGREEKAIEAATKMKAVGIAPDIISHCTGVTMEIIEGL